MVTAAEIRPARRPSTLGLIARQVIYQLKVLVRSPIASFATLVIPLMVLLAVNLLFNGTHLQSRGGIRYAQFFTPAMAAFAVVTACYMSVIVSTTLARDEGILKRVRSTPLPSWIYMTGRVVAAAVVATISSIVVLAVGAGVYGFQMVWSAVPTAFLALAMAIFCFCSLGFAVTVLVPKADAALPVAWGTILPLCFISDVFQPIDNAPHWLRTVASFFPLRPFADDLEAAFNPVIGTHGPHPGDLLMLAAWGVAAAVFAAATFRWEPLRDGSGRGGSESGSWRFAPDRLRDLVAPRAAGAPTARARGGTARSRLARRGGERHHSASGGGVGAGHSG